MLKLEKAMGTKFDKNKGHFRKANTYIIHLGKIIKGENLNKSDLKLATILRNKLIKAVKGIGYEK